VHNRIEMVLRGLNWKRRKAAATTITTKVITTTKTTTDKPASSSSIDKPASSSSITTTKSKFCKRIRNRTVRNFLSQGSSDSTCCYDVDEEDTVEFNKNNYDDFVTEMIRTSRTRTEKRSNKNKNKSSKKDKYNKEEEKKTNEEEKKELLVKLDALIEQPTGASLRALLRKRGGLFTEENIDDDDDDSYCITEYREENQRQLVVRERSDDEHRISFSTMEKRITLVSNIPYIHSSYAAASPLLQLSRKWMLISQHLMPQTHEALFSLEHRRQCYNSDTKKERISIMKRSESNPVVAAFGLLSNTRALKSFMLEDGEEFSTTAMASYTYPALEWDVFLDPKLVEDVESMLVQGNSTNTDQSAIMKMTMNCLLSRMLLAHGSATQLVMEATGMAKHWNFQTIVEASYEIPKQKQRQEYCGANGVCSKPDDVVSKIDDDNNDPTKKSGGGMFLHQWLSLFARSLLLGKMDEESIRMKITSEELESLPQLKTAIERRPRYWYREGMRQYQEEKIEIIAKSDPAAPSCGVMHCVNNMYPDSKPKLIYRNTEQKEPEAIGSAFMMNAMRETIHQITKLLGEPLRLVLDLKSRHVPPIVWSHLISKLHQMGLIIEGIGSFDIPELRMISSLAPLSVKKFIFFHSAGDLQRACHAQEIHNGDIIFFNAGSLLVKSRRKAEQGNDYSKEDDNNSTQRTITSETSEDYLNASSVMMENYGGLRFQPFAFPRTSNNEKKTIVDYKAHYKFQIGLYVQEYAIGPEELDGLIRFINDYRSIYNLGLAWGGKNGSHLEGVEGDGMANQRYVGRSWTVNYNVSAPSLPGMLGSSANHCYSCGVGVAVGVGIGGDDEVKNAASVLLQQTADQNLACDGSREDGTIASNDCNPNNAIMI